MRYNLKFRPMKKSVLILNILKVIFQIVFVLLCILNLAFLFLLFLSIFNENTGTLTHIKISLPNFRGTFSQLKGIGKLGLSIILFLALATSLVEAYMVFLVVKILKKLNFSNPFSKEISTLISKISLLSLLVGLFSILTRMISNSFMKKFIVDIQLGDPNFNFLIFAGIIYIIGKIYQRGVEIQSENDLTI